MVDELLKLLQAWLQALRYIDTWWQLFIVILAALMAGYFNRLLHAQLLKAVTTSERHRFRELSLKSARRILFPLSMLLGVIVGRVVLKRLDLPVQLLNIAVPLLVSMAAIRMLVYALRKGFTPSPAIKAWENLISTGIWILVALHLLGWLGPVSAALDSVAFELGKTRISLLAAIKLVVFIGILWVAAFWLSGVLERRMAGSTYLSPAMRVGLSKIIKLVLLTVAFLLALDAVGIDLTALTVFGGALGVGVGFGLQRIASNFISGFILIFDRSIKPGDVVSIGDKFGWVQELRARYIVVKDRDGVETLIPNENLVTSEVVNWSYSDQNVRLKIPVQISYQDDPEQAMDIMLEAAVNTPRVLNNPPPVTRLMEFGDNGISLELRVWINDPPNGVSNVLSEVNLGIWRGFKATGITIPFPQRDVHIKEVVSHRTISD